MATIKDAYELTSKAATAGIDAATRSIGGIGKALKSVSSIGAAPFKAIQAGLGGIGKVVGGITKGLGMFGLAVEGLKSAKEIVTKVFDSLRAQSPKLNAALTKVERSFQKLVGPILKKLGDALAPAFDKLAKILGSPTFKKFAELIGNLLIKGLNALMPILDKAFELFSNIIGVLGRGLDPFNAIVAIIGRIMRAFGAGDEQVSGFINTMFSVRDLVSQAWQQLQNIIAGVWNWLSVNVLQPLIGAVQQMAATFAQKWSEIQAAGQALWSALQPILQVIIDKLSEIWNTVLPALVAAFNGIVEEIGPAIAAVAGFFREHFGDIKNVVEGVFGGIGLIVKGAIELIGGLIKGFLQVLQGDWSGAWETIKGAVEGVWNAIKNVIFGAFHEIQRILLLLENALREPWEGLTNFVGGVWEGIKTWVLNAINSVIEFFNGIIQGFNDSVGRITGQIQKIPRVASLAQGGIVSSPIMAMVGDAPPEKGGEVVAPLADLLGMIQKAIGGGGVVVNVYGPFGPGYTPAQAGAEAGQAVAERLRARGVQV